MPTVSTQKKDGESNDSLIRRFVRKVQSSGKLNQSKGNQYRQKPVSKRLRRRAAIKRSELRTTSEFNRKIGKVDERSKSKFKR